MRYTETSQASGTSTNPRPNVNHGNPLLPTEMEHMQTKDQPIRDQGTIPREGENQTMEVIIKFGRDPPYRM